MKQCKYFYRRTSDCEPCCTKGTFCPYIIDGEECSEFEPRETQEVVSLKFNTTDWEQVRIQAAIAAMQGILANTCIIRWNDTHTVRSEFLDTQKVSTKAINYADALIEELKK